MNQSHRAAHRGLRKVGFICILVDSPSLSVWHPGVELPQIHSTKLLVQGAAAFSWSKTCYSVIHARFQSCRREGCSLYQFQWARSRHTVGTSLYPMVLQCHVHLWITSPGTTSAHLLNACRDGDSSTSTAACFNAWPPSSGHFLCKNLNIPSAPISSKTRSFSALTRLLTSTRLSETYFREVVWWRILKEWSLVELLKPTKWFSYSVCACWVCLKDFIFFLRNWMFGGFLKLFYLYCTKTTYRLRCYKFRITGFWCWVSLLYRTNFFFFSECE